jgi:hypothetical protein
MKDGINYPGFKLSRKYCERLSSCFSFKQFLLKCCLFILLLFPLALFSQAIRLKGLVKDIHGKRLPFTNVLILPDSVVIPGDLNGSFSIKVLPGSKNIIITCAGYEGLRSAVDLQSDTTISFHLSVLVRELKEVIIVADPNSKESLVQSTRTGTNTLTQKDINLIPALGGEADVIKTLQLLPGTIRGIEGTSDLFVRGGAADQNLVLLDGSPIYNTSHLFGFLSVFNPNILNKVEAINGGFPADYGGRLSSILNITSNNTIASKTSGSGDIGLIATRLYVEQPIVKEKASIWLAGRRTYIDQVIKTIGQKLPYYFYDLNGKMIFKPGKLDQLDISFYSGADILDLYRDRDHDGNGLTSSYNSGNTSYSIQWRHRHRKGWNSNMALFRSSYKYHIRNAFEENELVAFSDLKDYGAKLTFEKDSLWMDFRAKTGFEWITHSISPNIINTNGSYSAVLKSGATPGKTAHELALHAQLEWLLTRKLLINAGLRSSFAMANSKKYFFPEPRLSIRYELERDQSIKLSYSRMTQYLHRISNSAVSTPMDIWYPVTENIKPQSSHQLSAAWQAFLKKQKIFLSAEAYYKTMESLIGYEEGTNLFFNTDFESKLIQGKGHAYGFEFLISKEAGKLTGWLSYTLSWARRQYNEINNGQWFPSRFDRRHNGALVMQYSLNKRWATSMVWEFISGSRFTPMIGQYIVLSPTLNGVDLVPVYSRINKVKLADTHRLDLGIKFMSNPNKRYKWQWFAGVNNAYNRANPVGISIEKNKNDNSLKYTQPGLFGLLPFVSYGFKF